jgi:glycosyltransferase involved in cell wall biosynthesis
MKRALVCAPLPPEIDRESGSRRTFDLIMLLRDQGWAVSFLAQGGSAAHERYGRALRQRGVPVYAGSYAIGVGDEFLWEPSRLFVQGKFDLAILSFWHLAERYITALRHHSPGTRIIVDTIDLHFLRNARRLLNGDPGCLTMLDSRYGREMADELRAYAEADAVLTVSAREADLLNSLLNGRPPALVVPDMEELAPSDASFANRRGILFLGSFRHPPNREAAEILCRSILPRISSALLAEHPIYIVGNGLDDEIRRLGADLPHVRMVGWVPSVEPYLRQCRITVLPLRHGAGTKRKLVQALMVGTPSVSTAIGIEGLGLRHEQHVLVANDPSSFARAVERLMGDEPVWQQLAHAGRAHVLARHSAAVVRTAFLSAVDRAFTSSKSERAPAPDEAMAAGEAFR